MHRVRSHPTRKVCLWSGWQELGASLGRPVADILAAARLPARVKAGAEPNAADPATFYSPGAEGYADYPALGAG